MVTSPLRLVFDVDDEALQAEIEACEADVFSIWFGNTAADLAREYGPYPNVHWLAVLDPADHVAGVVRLFLPGPVRSKTLDDIALPPWWADPDQSARTAGLDPALTVDGATIAVRQGLGVAGRTITLALLFGLFAVPRANGCLSMTFMIDAVPDRRLHELGLHFRTLPGTSPQPYLGSVSTRPVYAHLGELLRTQQRQNPSGHRAVGQGIVEGVAIPPLENFVVPGQGKRTA